MHGKSTIHISYNLYMINSTNCNRNWEGRLTLDWLQSGISCIEYCADYNNKYKLWITDSHLTQYHKIKGKWNTKM